MEPAAAGGREGILVSGASASPRRAPREMAFWLSDHAGFSGVGIQCVPRAEASRADAGSERGRFSGGEGVCGEDHSE